jgi:hypothetical protein
MRAGTRTTNRTTTIQAPSVNFTIAKIATTIAVSTPADALITIRRRQPRSLRVWWYLAMPKPAIAKAVKTPIAYRGTRLLTFAPRRIRRATEMTVSRTMALENTSRWPRFSSQRGRNASPAT